MAKTSNVSIEKKNIVKELSELAQKKKSMLVVSIKGIPTAQIQEMVKKMRDKAIVKVPKKNLIFKALEKVGEEANAIKDKLQENVAILFSDEECFDLAAELVRNKSPAKAKPGQEAPMDIEVPAGPTELVPGPAISELSAVGLQVQVEKGKLTIRDAKVVAKKGDKITANVADVLSKLDIKPFTISLIPLAGYDSVAKKVYSDINIDTEKTVADLKEAFGRALPFAVSLGYVSGDTISYLLQKAGAHANKINRIMTGEPEPVAEAPKEEEKKEEPKKEDAQEAAAAGLGALFG